MNLFDDEIGASCYDDVRPYFHRLPASRLLECLAGRRVERALDVGCGTGQSSDALSLVAESVTGLDSSAAMLRHRRRREGLRYVRAVAEQLPFTDGAFELVSVGLAIHWFDHVRFVAEVSRVLKPASWLLAYDSGFCSRVWGSASFDEWLARYRTRFPSPERNAPHLTQDALKCEGFIERSFESFVHRHTCTASQLALHMATQSSVLFAVRDGRDNHDSALSWLRESLEPVFGTEARTVEFDGWLHLYERNAPIPRPVNEAK